MKVVIAADHRGFDLKEKMKSSSIGLHEPVEWVDVGAIELIPDDDYPDYAEAAVIAVRQEQDIKRAVLVCGSGVGICVAANKFKGVRAGLGLSLDQVQAARSDDNINMLVLAADYTNLEAAVLMTKNFLSTEYSKLPRHTRRIEKVMGIEEAELA